MRAGALRERLAFQSKTETISGSGVVSATWATVFTLWGRVKQEDARAAEQPIGGQPVSQTRLTMIIRHDSRVTTGMRVVWRSRVFEIEGAVNRDERRRSLDLLVIERDAP